MNQITLAQVRRLAKKAREELLVKAYAAEHDTIKVYLHWTAGWYNNVYDDYHINIGEHGEIYATTDDLSETLQHTWSRNSGSVAVALCCCADADTEDLGSAPPTAEQIEAMAKVIAALCDGLYLPITKRTVLTHGEAADNEDGDDAGYAEDECYGPKHDCERWDLEYLETDESPIYNPYAEDGSRGGDVLRGKANWYREHGY